MLHMSIDILTSLWCWKIPELNGFIGRSPRKIVNFPACLLTGGYPLLMGAIFSRNFELDPMVESWSGTHHQVYTSVSALCALTVVLRRVLVSLAVRGCPSSALAGCGRQRFANCHST